MSTRERWIVYPLLFLALGTALRDKFTDTLRIGHVVCNRMEAGQSECGALVVRGPQGRPAIVASTDTRSHGGAIEIFSSEGVPLVQLGSPLAGGVVLLTGRVGQEFGVFGLLPEIGLRLPLAVPMVRHEGKAPGKAPAKADQPAAAAKERPLTKPPVDAAAHNKKEATEPSAPSHP